MKKFLFILVFGCLNHLNTFCQPGSLDPGFDFDGKTVSDSTVLGTGMALQPDGKIVVIGGLISGSNSKFVTQRLLPNGSIDNSFSLDGIDKFDFDTTTVLDKNFANAVVIQPDGKILVAGFALYPGNTDFAVVRYNSNGTVDNTFGTNGQVTYDLSSGYSDMVNDMALDASGKIILAGNAYQDFAVCRLNIDGSLDTSFGIGGILVTDLFGQYDNIQSVIVLQDGRIAVCGRTIVTSTFDCVVGVYLSNGQPDSSFGGDGLEITAFDSVNWDWANSIVQQPDGKLVICGMVDTLQDFITARYLLNGNLDNTFSVDGYDQMDLGDDSETANDLIIQPDNKIVVGGSTNGDFAMIRYDLNGSLDTSFGTNGIVTTNIFANDVIASLAIQPDLKLLAGGQSGYWGAGPSIPCIGVARYDIGLYIGVAEFSISPEVLLYPNPVTETAVIRYTLLQDEILTVNLQNVHGQMIKTYLTNEHQSLGDHDLPIELPANMESGIYFVTLSTGSGSIVIKIIH
jgi:uncharacterized delta-60 repeat protein